MREELDLALCARWPTIFADRHGDPSETGMCWGFQCGDEWFQLIDLTCTALMREAKVYGAPMPVATQVKERLGSLRFRLKETSEGQRAMLSFAADFSALACE
jgi:hypothetical protein